MKAFRGPVRRGYRPTPDQELLLRAALFGDSTAVDSWNLWKSQCKLENIDPGSFRLLPLVYQNLVTAGVKQDPYLSKLKGIHRHTWSNNQILIHNAAELIKLFEAAGIKTMLLKGSALLLLYYKNFGLRPMKDIDVLVSPEHRRTASDLLVRSGFQPKHPQWEKHLPFLHSFGYRNDKDIQFDLHWYVFRERRQFAADVSIWEQSQQVEMHDVRSQVMSPPDQLLHVCVHGSKWNAIPPLRWITDSIQILRSAESRFDWQRFLSQTEEGRFIVPMREALHQLAEFEPGLVPLEILKAMEQTPVTFTELREYENNIRSNKLSLWGRFPRFWFDYQRHAGKRPPVEKIKGFLMYLKKFYGVQGWARLPFLFLFIAVRRVGRLLVKFGSRIANMR